MKALILNSGLGSRMGALTKEHPKCMTEIAPGETILSRQLKLIAAAGIEDVVITTGYYDRVLVEYCASLQNGDIGVFYVPGRGGVIKQVAWDRLHSLNPDYDDIFPYEDGARIVGRVLGRITADMIPGPEDLALYREAEETFHL